MSAIYIYVHIAVDGANAVVVIVAQPARSSKRIAETYDSTLVVILGGGGGGGGGGRECAHVEAAIGRMRVTTI